MQKINYTLVICGDGNFMNQLKSLIKTCGVDHKIVLKGMLTPGELEKITPQARLGIGFTEKQGLNQYLALPNKFFDYIHAGLPQLTMNFPEYKAINQQFKVALLLDDLDADEIAATVNNAMSNEALLQELRDNCLKARQVYNWQNEEKRLLQFYQQIFSGA